MIRSTAEILITGAAGFLGSRLACHLAARGVKVRAGVRRALSPVLQHEFQKHGIEVCQLDLRDAASLRDACVGVTKIVHLAALNDSQCRADPQAAIEVNVRGTDMLLQAATEAQVEAFYYGSTVHVYGRPIGHLHEGVSAAPLSSYGLTHKAAEDLVRTWAHATGKVGLSLRFSNVFGVPMDVEQQVWQLLAHQLCARAVLDLPAPVNGNPQEYRNFIPLTDWLRAVDLILNTATEKLPEDGLLNIGSNWNISVPAFAQKIAERAEKILNKKLRLEFSSGDSAAPSLEPLQYSTARLGQLGFSPQTTLDEELDLVLAYCQNQVPGLQKKFTPQPLISIILPTYNHARFLKESIGSVVAQTYQNWELIVVNNFSTDNTEEVVGAFADPRIRFFNYANQGIIGASRNFGLKEARGEYVAFLDSDDYWFNGKLTHCLEKLRAGADLVCHGERFFIDGKNQSWDHDYGPTWRSTLGNLLTQGNCLSTSAVVCRKQVFDQVGVFSTKQNIVTAEDYDLWIRMAAAGIKMEIISEVLGAYRIYETSASSSQLRVAKASLHVLIEQGKAQFSQLGLMRLVRLGLRILRVYGFVLRETLRHRGARGV